MHLPIHKETLRLRSVMDVACDLHARKLVDVVLTGLAAKRQDSQGAWDAKLSRLRTLWLEQLEKTNILQVPGAPGAETPQIVASVVFPPVQPPLKHRRLSEYCPPAPKVCGPPGIPALFLSPPARRFGTQTAAGSGLIAQEVTNAVPSSDLVSEPLPEIAMEEQASSATDLLVGVKVLANLPGLISPSGAPVTDGSIDAFSSTREKRWLPARVTSVAPRDKRAGKQHRKGYEVRIRFRNGAELEVSWPNNPHIYCWGDTGMDVFGSAGGGAEHEDEHDGGAASGDPPVGREEEGRSRSAEEALRILLGEEDGGDFDAEGTGMDRISSALLQAGQDGQEGDHLTDDEQEDAPGAGQGQLDQGQAQGRSGGRSQRAVPWQSQAGTGRQEALVATGQRVLLSQLREMEAFFSPQYRPGFRMVPEQLPIEGESGQSRREDFVSRRWVPFSSSSATASRPRETQQGAAQENLGPEEVHLLPEEDPSLPLLDPDIVVIGKSVRKFWRNEQRWVTCLQDVYVRDLRERKEGQGQGQGDTREGGRDLIVPVCDVYLSTEPWLIEKGGQRDRQEAENRELLRALLL